MTCMYEMAPSGMATQMLQNVCKQPDVSWGLENAEYITITVESGVSESARALRNDVKVWLENPKSHVTQVVTVKVSILRPEITVSV